MKKYFYNHPCHLVTIRPWPILTSFRLFITIIGTINIFNYYKISLISIGTLRIIICSYQWWRDIIRERTFQGLHSNIIYKRLKLSIILFIISELLFFISFFWRYLNSSLSPNIEIGNIWPPKNIHQFNPYEIPLLNTIILLSSRITITLRHYYLIKKKKIKSIIILIITIIIGIIFSIIQIYEYYNSTFSINDSIYGSLFFITTGFHGLHVIIGTLFLIISLIRIINNHLSRYHHFGFEASSWYWHFVDLIWIIVYSIIYWWNY